jgi:hypothetical protein
MEPALSAAYKTGDFTSLEFKGSEEVLDGMDDDSSPEEVCNALLTDLCGVGESAVFDTGLSELIHWVRKQPYGEEPGEMLAELITVAPNVEEWFKVEQGLVGILPPGDTEDLAIAFLRFRTKYKPPPPPRGLAAITRHFATSEPAVEHIQDLMDIIDAAAASHLGLAAFRED